jgi:2-polyprenyl-3-methyl-5-hydroxy-6-metoxy-1,4-benzoquinol methylase
MVDLASFYRTYPTENRDLTIYGRKFNFVVPQRIDPFIDFENIVAGFPLWAKIWEPSWILAEHVAKKPPSQFKKILEIGSGIGVVSIVAASFGHDVTMTEYDDDALQFASANAEINNCPDMKIYRLDWHRPDLETRYDTIIGSEVLFHERDFDPLLNLFQRYLKPKGRIIMASGIRQSTLDIIRRLHPYYHVRINKYSIRSEDTSMPAILCHLTAKK